jgi:hypothetical protein
MCREVANVVSVLTPFIFDHPFAFRAGVLFRAAPSTYL